MTVIQRPMAGYGWQRRSSDRCRSLEDSQTSPLDKCRMTPYISTAQDRATRQRRTREKKDGRQNQKETP